ncbi:hypothetical protein CVT25_009636 [Psilocybe cyanescens]|uniref:Uncharacterized protein n=1 Tax=Psilocybe cyanescens TaxID=93625 RepID=A0A409XGW4_PSICY|nr:hypothetical protein CVT25_009636 [Psilocybe cyanescens]
MAPLGEGPSPALDSTFGAMLIGVLAPSLATLALNIHLPLKMIIAKFSIPELVLTERESAALYFTSALWYLIGRPTFKRRLYTNSLLAALNARKKIRDRLQGSGPSVGQSANNHGSFKQPNIHMVSMRTAPDEIPRAKVTQHNKARSSDITFTVERVVRDDNGAIEPDVVDHQGGKPYSIWQTSADYEFR